MVDEPLLAGTAIVVGEGYVQNSADSLLKLFTPTIQIDLDFTGPARPGTAPRYRPIVGTAITWRTGTMSAAALDADEAVLPRAVLDCDWLVDTAERHMPSKEALTAMGVVLIKHATLEEDGSLNVQWRYKVTRSADWKVVMWVCPTTVQDRADAAKVVTMHVRGRTGMLSPHGFLPASEFGHLVLSILQLFAWWGCSIGVGTQLIMLWAYTKSCARGPTHWLLLSLALISCITSVANVFAWGVKNFTAAPEKGAALETGERLVAFALVGAPDVLRRCALRAALLLVTSGLGLGASPGAPAAAEDALIALPWFPLLTAARVAAISLCVGAYALCASVLEVTTSALVAPPQRSMMGVVGLHHGVIGELDVGAVALPTSVVDGVIVLLATAYARQLLRRLAERGQTLASVAIKTLLRLVMLRMVVFAVCAALTVVAHFILTRRPRATLPPFTAEGDAMYSRHHPSWLAQALAPQARWILMALWDVSEVVFFAVACSLPVLGVRGCCKRGAAAAAAAAAAAGQQYSQVLPGFSRSSELELVVPAGGGAGSGSAEEESDEAERAVAEADDGAIAMDIASRSAASEDGTPLEGTPRSDASGASVGGLWEKIDVALPATQQR
jgi:hypothetical protein